MRLFLIAATLSVAIGLGSAAVRGGDVDPAARQKFSEIWDVDATVRHHSDSLYEAAMTAFRRADYQSAARLFEESFEYDRARLHPENPRAHYSERWLAESLRLAGDSKGYEAHVGDYPFAPIDRRLTLESDSLSTLVSIIAEENPAEALRLMERVAEIEHTAVGEQHPYYANTLKVIAELHCTLQQFDRAIAPAREAADIRLKNDGDTSEPYLNALLTLAHAQHFSAILPEVEESIETRKRIISLADNPEFLGLQYAYLANAALFAGQEEADTAKAISYLADVESYIDKTQTPRALTDLRRNALERLALIYVNQNQSESLPVDRRIENEKLALDCYRRRMDCGGDSAAVAASHFRLALLQQKARLYPEATENLLTTLHYQLNNQQDNFKYLYTTYYHLGNIYLLSHRLREAEEMMRKSLENAIANFGPNSNQALAVKDQLVSILPLTGKNKEAREMAVKLLEETASLHGAESAEYAEAMLNMGNALVRDAQSSDGLDYIIRSLELFKKQPTTPKWMITQLRLMLMEKLANASDPRWEKFFLEWQADNSESSPAQTIDGLLVAAMGYRMAAKYDSSLDAIGQAFNVYEQNKLTDSTLRATLLTAKASTLCEMGKLNEAMQLTSSVIESDTILPADKLSALACRASINSTAGNHSAAISDLKSAIQSRNRLTGDEMNPYNIPNLEHLATYCVDIYDFAQADSLRRLALEIARRSYGTDSRDYLSALLHVESTPGYGDPYRQLRAQEAIIDFTAKDSGKRSVAYANAQLNKANLLHDVGRYQEALELNRQWCDTLLALHGESFEIYLSALLSQSSCLNMVGDHEEARAVADRVIALTEKYHPEKYARVNNALQVKVNSYYQSFDYGSALHEISEKDRFVSEKYGPNSFEHLMNILAMAQVNYELGDYDAARKLCERGLEIAANVDPAIRNACLQSFYSKLAVILSSQGDYVKALEYSDILLNDLNSQSPHSQLAITHNATFINTLAGNKAKALEMSQKTLANIERGMPTPINKGKILLMQGYCRVVNGDIDAGRELIRRGIALQDSASGGTGKIYLDGLMKQITVDRMVGDTEAARSNALRYSDIARKYVSSSFLTLPARGRQALWNASADFLMSDFPALAIASPSAEMASATYDNLLLGKGLMLSTQREIADLIAESRNPHLTNLYKEFILNSRQLENIAASKNKSFAVNVDSLKRVVTDQEFEIQKLCGDFMKPLTLNWKDVAAALGKDDAAVEFATFEDSAGKKRYLAAVVTRNAPSPKLIELPEANLTDIWNNRPETLSQTIWKPLAGLLGNVKNVSFSAAGELYTIPIESLADWDDPTRLVSDRWQLNRLSSTRELVAKNAVKTLDKAVIYGGLRYDASPETMEAYSHRYAAVGRNTTRNIDFAQIDSGLRGGASYLPQTLAEADRICDALEKKRIKASKFSADEGTETSFKALSGDGYKLIHIATHGFSWSDADSRHLSHLDFLDLEDSGTVSAGEDRAMSRCGLLFAGANNALTGAKIPDGIDDGILLAREIADLDFRDLDLLVLSACETGLGDVTGEGVFGLQRGFKKAGAGSILMSLWKVDDKATRMLMTKFYELLLAGRSKQNALREAQKYLREYEEVIEPESDDSDNMTASQRRRARVQAATSDASTATTTQTVRPYAAPRYWAAFILLDALQ